METAVDLGQRVQEFIDSLASVPAAVSEEDNIDRLQHLERAKRALAAAQAKATHAFVEQRQENEARLRITTTEQLKGIEAEVGLARGESPFVGAALTHMAIALGTVLPNTYTALAEGRVSEYHARIVADQTNHLSEAHRKDIDALITHRLGKASSSQLRKLIEGHAYRLDRKAADQRAADNARRRRRVCLDPAGEGMVSLTAELPTHQGLAVMDALKKRTNKRLVALLRRTSDGTAEADTTRISRDDLMADVFVEALIGQTTANSVTAEVVVVMHDTSLLGDDDVPAWIPGHGPLPAGMVKRWLSDPQAAKFFRRMYTRATDGQLVALESKRRHFPEGLSKMLTIRDDTCATPWCNSPIEDADHRKPWAKGGATSWDNATGLCKRCNQRKENRGWTYSGTPDRLMVTTPTGHQYTVPTRPPISQLRHDTTDPPMGPIDIAWRTAA